MTAGRIAWAVGAAGLICAAIGWATAPQKFFAAWLAGFLSLAGWPLGSLALLLAHTLTGGRWGEALRLPLLGGAAATALLIPAAIPLAFGLPDLYPWFHPAAPLANGFYLNKGFFVVRAAIYAASWIGLALLALWRRGFPLRLAPPAALLLVLSVSFAVIDLAQSLTPDFNSTVFASLAMAGMAGFGLAAALAAAVLAGERPPAAAGKILFGLVLLWAYLDFMQALIVWESDLAAETPWYIVRSVGAWGRVAWALAALHFLLPFFLLLSARLRDSADGMLLICLLLLAMEVMRWWWVVLPSLAAKPDWIDLAVVAGLGGSAVGMVASTRERLRLWSKAAADG